MTQVRIFEIESEEEDEEYQPVRPRYTTIVLEEEYESDDDEHQPKGWDFRDDRFFPVQ